MQDTFAGMLRDAGFKAVSYENLTGGIVAIHSGFKL
jgi:2-methoxy-6-polyprenyl-1,4-benzoquinol methylase